MEKLENATVYLRIYFWLNGSIHSWLKVRSSVIRLVKKAFQEKAISMPAASLELFFPDSVPVQLAKEHPAAKASKQSQVATKPDPIVTSSEDEFRSESEEIKEQARQSRLPEKGQENLLNNHRD